jgi:hypothetical protein
MTRIAAHVVDVVVVGALVLVGVQHRVAGGATGALGVGLPHRRGREFGQHRHARQQPPQHPVPDDQVGRLHRHAGTAAGHRVVGRGGQRQQHGTVAQVFADRIGLVARHHQRGCRGTEQAPHLAVAARAGHEHALADMVARGRPAWRTRPTDS